MQLCNMQSTGMHFHIYRIHIFFLYSFSCVIYYFKSLGIIHIYIHAIILCQSIYKDNIFTYIHIHIICARAESYTCEMDYKRVSSSIEKFTDKRNRKD